jgi:hypothetical protein
MLFAGRALSGFICIEPAGYAADDALGAARQYVSAETSHAIARGVSAEALNGHMPPLQKREEQRRHSAGRAIRGN